MDDIIQKAVSRLQAAIEEYQPIAVFGLFSGGHDSFTASYIASLVPQFTACVHINTGIGITQTREYVRKTCQDRNWPLLEYKAAENVRANGQPDPQIYENIVMEMGFPGPHLHGMMYNCLKERQLRRLERDYGASGRKNRIRRVLYVSGCRSEESDRRMANTNEIAIDGRRIWVAPIHDFTKLQCGQLMAHVKQPRNPVVDLIHKSGECLCGAFVKPGELDELKAWFPEVAAEILAIEARVKAAGFPWGWQDERPPEFFQTARKGQMLMTDIIKCDIRPELQHLCWSCNKRTENDS